MAWVKVGSTYYPEGRVPKKAVITKREKAKGVGIVSVGGRTYIIGEQYVPKGIERIRYETEKGY